jgi:putative transposase
MRKSRFTNEQMVGIIREADRGTVADVAKRHGVSEQTIYMWRKRFGELRAEDVHRLRQLEAENGRLKNLVAERDLEIEVMKEGGKKLVSVPARRRQVGFGRERGLSVRAGRHAVLGCPIGVGLSWREGGQRRQGGRPDEGAVGAISGLRLPPHSDLSQP